MRITKVRDRHWVMRSDKHEVTIRWSKQAYAWIAVVEGTENVVRLRAEVLELAFDAVWTFLTSGKLVSCSGAQWVQPTRRDLL